jgi:hypothetical protein
MCSPAQERNFFFLKNEDVMLLTGTELHALHLICLLCRHN